MLTFAGVNEARRCSATWPDAENAHSEGVGNAGTHKTHWANFATFGYLDE